MNDIIYLSIGGIIGYAINTSIDNSMNNGRIITTFESGKIGSLVGFSDEEVSIVNSFWTINDRFNASGSGKGTIDSESSLVTISSDVVSKLNSYSTTNSLSKWVLNMERNPIAFIVRGSEGFTLRSQVTLLIDFIGKSSEHAFSGWYENMHLATPFVSTTVSSSVALYSGWGFNVTFDGNGAKTLSYSSVSMFNKLNSTYSEFPDVSKAEHTLLGWSTEKSGSLPAGLGAEVVEPLCHTLYAQWIPSTCVLTFDFGNGTRDSKPYPCGTVISGSDGFPSTVSKTHLFVGWYTDSEFTTSFKGFKIESDTTIYAKYKVATMYKTEFPRESIKMINSFSPEMTISFFMFIIALLFI